MRRGVIRVRPYRMAQMKWFSTEEKEPQTETTLDRSSQFK